MDAAETLAPTVGVRAACEALAVPRASFYRRRKAAVAPEQAPEPKPRPPSHRALSPAERGEVLDVLHSERFVDCSPREVYAELLDEGRYVCSVSTMYRVLRDDGEVRERRNQIRHPNHPTPRLVAHGPNEVWSWDITKLLGPAKWTYYYLYVILDIFSRYVVGWMVADRESAALAKQLIEETCRKEGIGADELALHADRGSSMTSKTVALLLADLGVTKTHSRPRVSNDNPYSESQFKTLKYRLDFPERFGSAADARAFCREFFPWYNGVHHHSALGLLTPEQVHRGETEFVLAARQTVLDEAHQRHPERFVRRPPQVGRPADVAWINRPSSAIECETIFTNS